MRVDGLDVSAEDDLGCSWKLIFLKLELALREFPQERRQQQSHVEVMRR
jgi:hypothetical protein